MKFFSSKINSSRHLQPQITFVRNPEYGMAEVIASIPKIQIEKQYSEYVEYL